MSRSIKNKIDKDLMVELSEKQTALRAFRFSVSGGKAKNVLDGRAIRKDIARILTELRARTISQA